MNEFNCCNDELKMNNHVNSYGDFKINIHENLNEELKMNNHEKDNRVFKTKYRIGYWIADKKYKKLKFEDFEDLCRNSDLEIIRIDLNKPLDIQGPFDLIFHKLTDQITKGEHGCKDASFQISAFKEFIFQNPQIIVIDPIEKIMQLFDRNTQYSIIQEVLANSEYFTPNFVQLNSKDGIRSRLLMKNIPFPIVYKPIVSHGASECHEMAIIFNEQGLKDIDDFPCVVQHFVNHDAQLFKVFLIGKKQYIVLRPSIRNLYPGDFSTIYFNSNDVSRPDAASYLNEELVKSNIIYPLKREIHELCSLIQERFQLQLLGIDIIMDNITKRLAVIDINTFPGYEDVPNFFQLLLDFLINQIKEN